ncbi:fungal specific transcription factor domain-containing protein [Aspergillus mulundensis]|uniref:Xylanolytic transcriptional activator regulatory domain-containing protein n=1 Tax=Aspergillus mulundensis TaxID=1810919 RepID=A0A3D8RYX6_9EURO|nr:hypothetical protein DSM5745_06094 [Aspergillus mulundensis]RDW79242.1 hypothetical protein DSM5745_06094 [Aspergillus mulundensis]
MDRSARPQEPQQSVPELEEENEKLKAELERLKRSSRRPPPALPVSSPGARSLSTPEVYENRINLQHAETVHHQTVRRRGDIRLPNRGCSDALLRHGIVWTSWIHFATHNETFQLEHEAAWMGGAFLDSDPLWLAIYFAFIAMSLMFMTDTEATAAELPEVSSTDLVRNWYDAAIYFLNKAEFMRNYNFKTVQAITILLSLGKSVGDFNSQPLLQATAIRIGQIIGMDREPPLQGYTDSPIVQEISRRTWWTLMICEWLSVPPRPPCIHELDFNVDLPLLASDEELSNARLTQQAVSHPRPVQYHLAMISIAKSIYRFQYQLAWLDEKDARLLEDLVLATDEDLATIISQLPAHLSDPPPPEGECDNHYERAGYYDENYPPWVSWQWRSLTLTLLIFRMRVNRCLQHRWPHLPSNETLLARSKAICLESASTVIMLVDRDKVALARHRPWSVIYVLGSLCCVITISSLSRNIMPLLERPLTNCVWVYRAMTFYVFSAAMTLAIEARGIPRRDVQADEYIENIQLCLSFLDFLKDHTALAARAILVLNEFLNDANLRTEEGTM